MTRRILLVALLLLATGAATGQTLQFRLLDVLDGRELYVAAEPFMRENGVAKGVFLDNWPQGRRLPRNVMAGSAVQVVAVRCGTGEIWTEGSLIRSGPGLTGTVIGLKTEPSPASRIVAGSMAAFQQALLCGGDDVLRTRHARARTEHPGVAATMTVDVENMRGVR